jgi:hypothetical protein
VIKKELHQLEEALIKFESDNRNVFNDEEFNKFRNVYLDKI